MQSMSAPVLLLITLVLSACRAQADRPEIHPVRGPRQVTIIEGVANFALPEGLAFIDEAETRALLETSGEPPDHAAGLIVPTSRDEQWSALLSWREIGWVSDHEADTIDPVALLEQIKEGTAQHNEARREKGAAELTVREWAEPPHYDKTHHVLHWALECESQGARIVNVDRTILGRKGVLSLRLVTDAADFAKHRERVDALLGTTNFVPGQQHSDFVEGADSRSDWSLTTLVVGGTLAAAANKGILAKLFMGLIFLCKKAWAVVAVTVGALVRRVLKKRRGSSKAEAAQR
jgi:uncharacterized membrane-anchored protein